MMGVVCSVDDEVLGAWLKFSLFYYVMVFQWLVQTCITGIHCIGKRGVYAPKSSQVCMKVCEFIHAFMHALFMYIL